MKLSVPAIFGRKPAGDGSAAANAGVEHAPGLPAGTGGPIAGLGKTRMQLLTAGVVLLGVLALFIFQFMSARCRRT